MRKVIGGEREIKGKPVQVKKFLQAEKVPSAITFLKFRPLLRLSPRIASEEGYGYTCADWLGHNYGYDRRFHGHGRHLGSGANTAKFTVNIWGKS